MSTDVDATSLLYQTCDDTARCTRAKAVIICHPTRMSTSNAIGIDFSSLAP
jgi:hypothetical protein